jgi:Fe-S cluster biogenesis protein NfuA
MTESRTERAGERQQFQQQFGRIEELIGKLEKTTDPAARATAKELVQLLMEIHGAGLEKMLEIASQSGAVGVEMIDHFGKDEVVRNLLVLYGLHPVDLETRVAMALEEVRPYLRSRDSNVELISVIEGAASVRLTGNAHGCTASTLKSAIEEALYKEAPDLVSVSVETEAAAPASVFIPLAELRTLNATRH